MTDLSGLSFSGEELTEATLTSILQHERARAVGLDNDDDLNRHREMALEYFKGVVPDMPVATDEDGQPVDSNRSSATTTDLADMVETVLPDLIEVFFGGEDALSFRATSEEDVDATEQETDYLRQIIFQRNDGFSQMYTWFKEALLCRVGIAKWCWNDDAEYEDYEQEVDPVGLQQLQEMGLEIVSAEPNEETGMITVECRKTIKPPTVEWMAVPSSDFATAPETVRLKDAPYCIMRSNPQVQDLIADGYDAEIVRGLPDADSDEDEGVDFARNTSREDEDETVSMGDLRRVEVMEHYIRADLEGNGKPQIWRITTADSEKVILDLEKRPAIEYSAVSPYPMPFKLIGQDLADKVMPWQRINTALLRNGLDNNNFQLNARLGIAEDDSTEDTIDDVLDNDPGVPIRMKRQGAVFPIQSSPLAINPFETIEQIKSMEEQSTGVIRAAQGLNPDSLHQTKGGMQIQNNAAQKRVRMMARLFAETGVKDLFLGVHDMLRSNATQADTVRLKGKYVPIDPQQWSRRMDMDIEIGVGSGGRDADIAALGMMADRTGMLVEAQGGMSGPLVTPENVYNLYKALGDRLGLKQVGTFISNPADQPPQQEGPDPEVQAEQAKLQMEQQKAQMQAQMDQQKMQSQIQLEQTKAQADAQLARERAQMEMDLARAKADAEMQLAREKAQMEAQLARERNAMQAANNAQMSKDRPGGSLAQ